MPIQRNPLIPAGAAAVAGRFLARMRTDTCVIQRPGADVDPGGAPITGGYGTVDVRECRVTPVGAGREAVSGGRAEATADYEIRFPIGVDIRENDRILALGSETTYEVVGPPPLQTHGLEIVVPVTVAT